MRTEAEIKVAYEQAQGLLDVVVGWELAGASHAEINLRLERTAEVADTEVLTYEFIQGMHRSLWWAMGNNANADEEFLRDNGIDPTP